VQFPDILNLPVENTLARIVDRINAQRQEEETFAMFVQVATGDGLRIIRCNKYQPGISHPASRHAGPARRMVDDFERAETQHFLEAGAGLVEIAHNEIHVMDGRG